MKKVIFLLIVQIFLPNFNYSQSISESFGGIKTNFEVFSDSIDLEVKEQIVILAAERLSYLSASGNGGWGYGYQSYHFDFITKKRLIEEPTINKNKNTYQLTFTDSDNVILQTFLVPAYSVDIRSNEHLKNTRIFYSIDLFDTPIMILDKTRRINIIFLN